MHDTDKRWWGWEAEAAKAREMEKWAKEDREFIASINWKSKWLDRSVIIGLFVLIIVAVGIGNAPHTAVEVPVYDAHVIQDYKIKLGAATKTIADYKQQTQALKAMLLVSNTKVARYEQERASLASVPSQPVILQAIQQEAVTEKELRQVVARNFGADIAKRMEVR